MGYLVLDSHCDDSIATEILNSFAHSLKFLSIKGTIDASLDLDNLNIFALRISMNNLQISCKFLWSFLPSSLKYLCLHKTTFAPELLNKNVFQNLLHLSLIDSNTNGSEIAVKLPRSLMSLHIKNFEGLLSCKACNKLWEVVIHVDMKSYNQQG